MSTPESERIASSLGLGWEPYMYRTPVEGCSAYVPAAKKEFAVVALVGPFSYVGIIESSSEENYGYAAAQGVTPQEAYKNVLRNFKNNYSECKLIYEKMFNINTQNLYEDDVQEFHDKHEHPVNCDPDYDSVWVEARTGLLIEEAEELIEAIEIGDRVKIAREAIDLVYVTIGVLLAYGIPMLPVWRAVHRSNMQKGKVPIGQKPTKGDSWVSPEEEIDIWIRRD